PPSPACEGCSRALCWPGISGKRVRGGTMPLYEYYCEPCNGVFELLRPAREASKPQPCPECDEDARRIMSREWSAFIFREGSPRRLPDTGGYWHLGKRVSAPMTRMGADGAHPELKKREGPKPVTAEEVE